MSENRFVQTVLKASFSQVDEILWGHLEIIESKEVQQTLYVYTHIAVKYFAGL